MTAKEMFKKLNYYEGVYADRRKNRILYIKGYPESGTKIEFDLEDKTVVKYSFDKLDYFVRCVEEITFNELQAINKQIEELVWLNE